ncbi:FMN-dependent NADH-azoreductase [Mucilaginibacter aquaedulcis]|uniref:FMN-dependent NADH-azoreductase n=1 Tax=Mucilaginibacter aquaedulcis TaxID=1187081 RepID=UPI0025B56E8A|nr:NAD(P)H-dependent oxidoreductase [Mucilaginibacter aquaedulcis]MDN3551730.1 NAD(P)H-dependent oxidoreductase [Mucilaginibacter aquaedulcis]
MKNLLIINASPRGERSTSRNLTNLFGTKWIESNPDYTIQHREVGQEAIPHVSELWIAGAFKPAELRTEEEVNALKISDQLIAELKAADVIVLGTPMYNWSIPSALKAYLDQVIRANETIAISNADPKNPYTGLLKNKKVYLLLTRGNAGYEKGEFYAHMNFQTDYLKTVFNIMGITDIQEVALNGSAFDQELFEQSKKDVHFNIAEMAANTERKS